MLLSRILAVLIVLAAALWIGSGVVGRGELEAGQAETAPAAAAPVAPRFRVAVVQAKLETHARRILLSGRTEADRKASAIARAAGTIVKLNVRRGSVLKEGDVVAVLSDEARVAMVDQAKAKLMQRQTELKARLQLIERGISPTLNKAELEAELRAAEAGLAQAEVERDKGKVLAPIPGVVASVPVVTGQALQAGNLVAEMVALDPMLAVVEIAERQLGGVRVGDRALVRLVTGSTAEGRVRFISPTASPQTRTYRIDVEIPNKDGAIPDGVTCEVSLELAPAEASRVPRSALTFSAEGRLAVRTVDDAGKVATVPVRIMEDAREEVWLAGLPAAARVIVQGQDFVKDGELVTAVPAGAVGS